MSGHWRGCCCAAQTYCPGTCDFASSYLLSGINGSVSWETSVKYPLCEQCGDYDSCDLKSAWSFDATFYQLTPVTLTRVIDAATGAFCCYQATGTMVINYTLSRAERIKTCGYDEVCEISDTWSGTTETTFCYQVSCDPYAWNGGQGWVHTLTMCSWEVKDIEIMVKDCSAVIGSTDCPLALVKVVAGGLTTSWVSKFASLTALDPDIAWQGWCNLKTADCNYVKPGTDWPTGDGIGCMPKMQEQSRLYGPMALFYFPYGSTFTECDWTPSQCTWSGIFPCGYPTDQVGLNYCGGDTEYDTDCCNTRFNAVVSRATFS